MSSGLMQLIAYGAEDVYLTGNPQMTFFKTTYRRHTAFGQNSQIDNYLDDWKEQIAECFSELFSICQARAGRKKLIEQINIEVRLVPDRGIDYFALVEKYRDHVCFSC